MSRCPVAIAAAALLVLSVASPALAQYAVGHRSFGGGTSAGIGYSRMDYQFDDVDPNGIFPLLPTLEFKLFFTDTLSLDLSVPVVNLAASNALQNYFFFLAEAFIDFHPSAPGPVELFVAPGFGVAYAAWKSEDEDRSESGYAFHVPVRLGLEFNSARRTFSFQMALRPFFALVHGGDGDNSPGGGALLELGFMAYAVKYRADRY